MKNIFFWMMSILIISGFGCDRDHENGSVDLKKELMVVENILEKYVMANENQNFEMIEEIWAEDEDIILLGTDSDEIYIGWKSIKKAIQHQFKSFEDTYIAVSDQKIMTSKTGNTAWFSENLNYNFIYKGEAKSFEGIRFTGVLEKREGQWLMVQAHLSIPVKVGTETGQ